MPPGKLRLWAGTTAERGVFRFYHLRLFIILPIPVINFRQFFFNLFPHINIFIFKKYHTPKY
jgi:hypothetical protein